MFNKKRVHDALLGPQNEQLDDTKKKPGFARRVIGGIALGAGFLGTVIGSHQAGVEYTQRHNPGEDYTLVDVFMDRHKTYGRTSDRGNKIFEEAFVLNENGEMGPAQVGRVGAFVVMVAGGATLLAPSRKKRESTDVDPR